MSRNDQTPRQPMRIPTITAAERAAGFIDWDITLADGSTETVRIYALDAVRFSKEVPPESWAKYFMEVVANSLRCSVEYASKKILGVHVAEIFLIAHRLHSEELFKITFEARGIIGRQVVAERLPGGAENPTAN